METVRSIQMLEATLHEVGAAIPWAVLDALDAVDPIVLDKGAGAFRQALLRNGGGLGVVRWLMKKDRLDEAFLRELLDALASTPQGGDGVREVEMETHGRILLRGIFQRVQNWEEGLLPYLRRRALLNNSFMVARELEGQGAAIGGAIETPQILVRGWVRYFDRNTDCSRGTMEDALLVVRGLLAEQDEECLGKIEKEIEDVPDRLLTTSSPGLALAFRQGIRRILMEARLENRSQGHTSRPRM